MQGRDLTAQLRAELQQIMPLVSAMTGLPSRWSGIVHLVHGADFNGKKRFSCDIELNAALATQDERWRTLIHEALHSCSAGYNRTDYNAQIGWEEGVVEQFQRLYRPNILSRLGVSIRESVFTDKEEEHAYNPYIAHLEMLRKRVSYSEAEFYRTLLSIPIVERHVFMLNQLRVLPIAMQQTALMEFSIANARLREKPRVEGAYSERRSNGRSEAASAPDADSPDFDRG